MIALLRIKTSPACAGLFFGSISSDREVDWQCLSIQARFGLDEMVVQMLYGRAGVACFARTSDLPPSFEAELFDGPSGESFYMMVVGIAHVDVGDEVFVSDDEEVMLCVLVRPSATSEDPVAGAM